MDFDWFSLLVRRPLYAPPLQPVPVMRALFRPSHPAPRMTVTRSMLSRMIAPQPGDEEEPRTRWLTDRGFYV